MKSITCYDPKTKEAIDFIWDQKGDPLLERPGKKRAAKKNQKEKEREN